MLISIAASLPVISGANLREHYSPNDGRSNIEDVPQRTRLPTDDEALCSISASEQISLLFWTTVKVANMAAHFLIISSCINPSSKATCF
jgi:hypothetical protein